MCLALPGRIVALAGGPGLRTGTVDFAGLIRDCCLAYVPEARVGDYVIVHVGFAMAVLDEEAALESLALFAELGALDDETGELPGELSGGGRGG